MAEETQSLPPLQICYSVLDAEENKPKSPRKRQFTLKGIEHNLTLKTKMLNSTITKWRNSLENAYWGETICVH